MKTISPALLTHIADNVTTMAYLWKAIRQDGEIFAFTSHDEPITFDGITYEASTGFLPSAVATNSGLAVDDVELEGILESPSITSDDLVAGRWDGAEIQLYKVNYKSLADGAIYLRRGWLGEVRAGKVSFVAELRGLAQKLQQQIGQNYSPSCRASFCDSRCKLVLDDYKFSGAITTATDSITFTDTSRTEADGYFNFGLVEFTSGNNMGVQREVKSFAAGVITLELPMPFAMAVGDAYDIWRGCDKNFSTCKDTYDNVINFRGEPYVPTIDEQIKGPA